MHTAYRLKVCFLSVQFSVLCQKVRLKPVVTSLTQPMEQWTHSAMDPF